MTSITIAEAREMLDRLVDRVSETHEPMQILGKCGNAVLVSEDDWRSVQETLYLLSVPGVRESIREGMSCPLHECEQELDW